MAGFLDSYAPSITAEYTRFLEGDAFGKILFKNFLRTRIGVAEQDIYIPRGRHGDVESEQEAKADAQVRVDGTWRDFEVKFARINKANRYLGAANENWAFSSLLTTGRIKQPKTYDIAIAILVRVLGAEESSYWDYMTGLAESFRQRKIDFDVNTLPHEEAYLSLCGFFIIPFAQIETDYFRVSHGALPHCRYHSHFTWGDNKQRCRELWTAAISNFQTSVTPNK